MEPATPRTEAKRKLMTSIAENMLPHFPDLKKKLFIADMKDTPVEFMEKAVKAGVFATAYLTVLTLLLLIWTDTSLVWLPALFLVYLIGTFFYFMLAPEAAGYRRTRELDYEIVFAGRHIVIALKSGMPLFDSIVGATSGYGEVSRELVKIADKVVLGVPMTQAIREVAQYSPSKYFVRILMQISNSLASGADIGGSLEAVLEQISKEQMISLKEYSQKLTPMVMFYMVFGIIVPSLGIVLATVVFSVISGGKLGLTSTVLIPVFCMITIVQFLFLGVIESSRPKYLL